MLVPCLIVIKAVWFYRREFLFCARWEELRIFVNKTLQESFNRFLFFLTKQKGSVELILLALESNSTGSVLINDGTLGAGIKELKPGAAAPTICQQLPFNSVHIFCHTRKLSMLCNTLVR